MNRKRKLSHKINYIAYVASSIDGRIAKSNQSGTDWTSKEDWNFFQKSISKFDAVVVGHNTYKVAENWLKKRRTIVFTSRYSFLKSIDSVTFLNPAHVNFLNFIHEANFKKIAILGGPKVYTFFLENKMLDELFVTIEPYIFINGVPMFSGDRFHKYRFILQSVKKLNKRSTILLHYKNGN